MDLSIIKDIFGLETAAFFAGVLLGYAYAKKVVLPREIAKIEKDLPTETLRRNCALIESAYGGYKNEVKISVRGDRVINCACPRFNWADHTCDETKKPCLLFNNGKI